jgi:hypothetical protein
MPMETGGGEWRREAVANGRERQQRMTEKGSNKDSGRQWREVKLASARVHRAITWGTQDFWEEENRHDQDSIYSAQFISIDSR